jgi:hypothetical protein
MKRRLERVDEAPGYVADISLNLTPDQVLDEQVAWKDSASRPADGE